MKMDEKAVINSAGLEEKIKLSTEIIKEGFERFGDENIAVAWTGGKDSTTLLWLFRNVCNELSIPMPKCMFIDEGDVFDEIIEIVERLKNEWGLNVVICKNSDVISKTKKLGDIVKVKDLNERNKHELKNINFEEDEFPFEPESYVGNHLMKTVPMKMFIENNSIKALATAIRWDEQEARIAESYFSPRNNPEHTRIHAILSYLNGQVELMLLSIALSGTVIGFLRYNWYPSKLFMGDAGSLFLGFALAFLSIAITQKDNSLVPPVVPLLILAIPIVDTLP